MTELREKIRRLHVKEGLQAEAIAKALSLAVDEVRDALKMRDEASTPAQLQRPDLPKFKAVDPDIAAIDRMNVELQDRARFGYRPEPGGGKLRDGRPAPAAGELHRAYETASDHTRRRGRLGL